MLWQITAMRFQKVYGKLKIIWQVLIKLSKYVTLTVFQYERADDPRRSFDKILSTFNGKLPVITI